VSEENAKQTGSTLQRYIVTGVLVIIPIWITWLVVEFLLKILAELGRPVVIWLSGLLGPVSLPASELLLNPWVQSIAAVILVLLALYLLGWLATRVFGRRIITMFDNLINRIPLAKKIYGAVKKLLEVLQQKPGAVQRVVLIDFPSPEMKTVGLVTRTLVDQDTGRELAAVYVPTTPNPTSGYLEIVPVEKITSTNWTLDEALTFVISGGAVAPEKMNYDRSVPPPDKQVVD
jgi:uncharacterized membrane protein